MDLATYAALVAAMRTKQRLYFRHRGGLALQRAKEAEKEVDAATAAILTDDELLAAPPVPAADLFAGQPAPPDAGHYGEGR